ncbi:MAG TPA: nitroreductase family protein [Myxococcota bacterium]|nr:nitroreductase family protein [Myxococcota bacterium]
MTAPSSAGAPRREIDVAALGEDVKLFEAMRTTRAIRRLLPDPVPPPLIRKVCEAATFAPSGGNRQPWKFIALTEPERKRWVADRYRAAFMHYIAPALEAAQSPGYPERKRRNQASALHLAEHMAEAPVLLFVAGWTRRGQPQLQALMPCVQNLLLACRAVGLGASLTTMHRSFGAECDAWLGLPEGCPTCALIPIGWPRGRYGTPPRRPVDESLFFERYDAARDLDAQRGAREED